MADQIKPDGVAAEREAKFAAPAGLAEDIWELFWSPGRLFDRLPFCNRVNSALVILFLAKACVGAAIYAVGVHQFQIDEKTHREVAVFQKLHEADEEFELVSSGTDALLKGGEFSKQLLKVWLVIGSPIAIVLSAALIAAVWFVIVALTVGKPNFQLLAGVVAFASLVEIPQWALQAALMRGLSATRVELSLAALAGGPEIGLFGYIFLRRMNPFTFWFWSLVGLGVWRVGQLPGRKAVFWTIAMGLLSGIVASALDVLELAELPPMQFGGQAK